MTNTCKKTGCDLKIIVNADDLGESLPINGAIRRYACDGLISSASLLPNGPGFEDALKVVRDCDDLSIGAHLNLTQFSSLSRSPVLVDAGITDENGCFTGAAKWNSSSRLSFDRSTSEAVYEEWRLQLTKLYDCKISITHIDGHNHVHYYYRFMPIIKRLQKQFGIKRIRIRDVKPITFYGFFNSSLEKKMPPLDRQVSNLIWNCLLKAIPPRTMTVNHVFSYLSLCRYLSTGSRCPKRGVFEVVAHPGSDYLSYFAEENRLIERRRIHDLIPKFKLISYRDLEY
jgi:hypothetical protein